MDCLPPVRGLVLRAKSERTHIFWGSYGAEELVAYAAPMACGIGTQKGSGTGVARIGGNLAPAPSRVSHRGELYPSIHGYGIE